MGALVDENNLLISKTVLMKYIITMACFFECLYNAFYFYPATEIVVAYRFGNKNHVIDRNIYIYIPTEIFFCGDSNMLYLLIDFFVNERSCYSNDISTRIIRL